MFVPQLDNFNDLDLEFIEGGFQNQIIEHEYPNTSGADLEYTGAKARRFRFVVWFRKDRYSEAASFRSYLADDQIVSFVHPVLGLIKGRISASNERFEDYKEKASFDITIVEDGVSKTVELPTIDVVPETEKIFAAGIAEQKDLFNESAASALGDTLTKDVAPGSSLASQFRSVSYAGRAMLVKLDAAIAVLDAAATEPTTGPLSDVAWGSTIADRVLHAVATRIETVARDIQALKTSPLRMVDTFFKGISEVVDACKFLADALTIHAASRGATELAGAYDIDEQNRDVVRQIEAAPVFDAQGNYLRTQQAPAIATINELEQSLALAREWCQKALDVSRSLTAPVDAAMALLRHVDMIKLERDRVVTINVDSVMPLHLVCLIHGLPFTCAERVLSINPQIVNPSFVQGPVLIYAR